MLWVDMRWQPWTSGESQATGRPTTNPATLGDEPDPSSPDGRAASATTSTDITTTTTKAPHKSNKQSRASSPSAATAGIAGWASFGDPRILVQTVVLTSTIVLALQVRRRYLCRFPDAGSIPPSYFRRKSVFGYVTSVGDGDNFRIFHTPGGRMAGWGWLPWMTIPVSRKDLKDNTVYAHLWWFLSYLPGLATFHTYLLSFSTALLHQHRD